MQFVHDTPAQRVVFDAGNAGARLRDEVSRLHAQRVMMIASASAAGHVEELVRGLPVVCRWDEVVMHVPLELAERARAAAAEEQADLLVCVGGGSAIGVAKAVAVTGGQPIVALPTTYSGSEGTSMWGVTEDRTKRTAVDPVVLPTTVIYDAEFSRGLPLDMSVASGLNALAHCVDALWAPNADPINAALALEGARAMAAGLTQVVTDPSDLAGREECLYGAYLSAVSLSSAGSGLHHKICHVLGGTWNLPHAQTHAVVLPHVLAFNEPAVPELSGRLAGALGGQGPASAVLAGLYAELDAPHALRDIGMPLEGLGEAAERVVAVAPDSNPRPVTVENMTALLHDAWAGRPVRGTIDE